MGAAAIPLNTLALADDLFYTRASYKLGLAVVVKVGVPGS